MDTFAQLNAVGFLLFFSCLFLFGWILYAAAIWKVFAFFRDVHSISESLHWIAHCTRAPEQPVQAARPAPPLPTGKVSMSQFGR